MWEVIYISGKYSASTAEGIKDNIKTAKMVAVSLWEHKFTALCPHLNTANFEDESKAITWEDYLEGDKVLVDRSDAILMLPGWEDSKGARVEFDYAKLHSMPIFYVTEANYLSRMSIFFQKTTEIDVKVEKDIAELDIPQSNNVEGGKKFDGDKLRWDLIDYAQIKKLASILSFGSKKYQPNNWQKLPEFNDRYFAALMRHITAWRSGELKDSESGVSHLDHAFTNLFFLMWGEDNGK